MKMYFETEHSEICYPMESMKDIMRMNGLAEMEVYEAKQEKGTGMFWCKHFGEIGFSHESCGRQCAEYSPRNGKSGRCRYHKTPYALGEKVTIKI